MSEKEKIIIEKLIKVIPQMSEFDKGYILGKTESLAQKDRNEKHPSDQNNQEIATL